MWKAVFPVCKIVDLTLHLHSRTDSCLSRKNKHTQGLHDTVLSSFIGAASLKSESPEPFPASGLRPSMSACLPPSYHFPSLPSQKREVSERAEPLLVTQRNPSDVSSPAQVQRYFEGFVFVETVLDHSNTCLCLSQHQISQIYTGTPFPSILRSGRGQRNGRYTPRPLLDPARRGTGLSFNLSPEHHREAADGGGDGGVLP